MNDKNKREFIDILFAECKKWTDKAIVECEFKNRCVYIENAFSSLNMIEIVLEDETPKIDDVPYRNSINSRVNCITQVLNPIRDKNKFNGIDTRYIDFYNVKYIFENA